MATEISGRNIDVTPELRKLIETKLSKIQEKLFTDVIDVRCVLQVEKYRNICEILIVGKDQDAKTVQESDESMEAAVNLALDHLKRQAQKNRKKIRDHRRGADTPRQPITEWSVQVLDAKMGGRNNGDASADGEGRRIIKTANLPIRPMSVEHAALMLDDSKNEFIVFRDVDTDKISVIYKRKDDSLGLIAPEI